MPTKHLFKSHANTKEWRKNNNKFIALEDKDEIEEKEKNKTKDVKNNKIGLKLLKKKKVRMKQDKLIMKRNERKVRN